MWNDFSPRTVGRSTTSSGNGKTAVRAGFNKFMTAATTGFAQLYNPTALTTRRPCRGPTSTATTSPRASAAASILTPGCEINFANLPSNFGVRSLAQFDPDLKRPYQLALQPRRLARGVAAASSVTRGVVPQRLQGPDRAQQRGAHGARLHAGARRQPDRRQRRCRPTTSAAAKASAVAERRQHRSEPEALATTASKSTSTRGCRGGVAPVRRHVDRADGRRTAAARRPTIRTCSLFCDRTKSGIPLTTSFKLAGIYPLPWYGITVSGALQALAGIARSARAAAVRRLHRRHRLRPARTARALTCRSSPTTNYDAANCKSSACTIGRASSRG